MFPAVRHRSLPFLGAISPRQSASSQNALPSSTHQADQVTFGSSTKLGRRETPPPLRIVLSAQLAKQTEEHPGLYHALLQRWESNQLYPPNYPGVLSRLHQNGWHIVLDLAKRKPAQPQIFQQHKTIYAYVDENTPGINLKTEIAHGIAQAINAGALKETRALQSPRLEKFLRYLQYGFKISDQPSFKKALEPLLEQEYSTTDPDEAIGTYCARKAGGPTIFPPVDPFGRETFENTVSHYLLGNQDEMEQFRFMYDEERALAHQKAMQGINKYISQLLEPYREIQSPQD